MALLLREGCTSATLLPLTREDVRQAEMALVLPRPGGFPHFELCRDEPCWNWKLCSYSKQELGDGLATSSYALLYPRLPLAQR